MNTDGTAAQRKDFRARLAQRARTDPRILTLWTVSAGAVALFVVAVPLEVVLYHVPLAAAGPVLALQCGSLVLGVRRPVLALAVFATATIALASWVPASSVPWPWTLTGIITFALLGGSIWAISGWRSGLTAYLVPATTMTVLSIVAPQDGAAVNAVVADGVGAAVLLVGASVHEWRRIAAELAVERAAVVAETERRTVVEERQRIARELHDVVAHGLSLIQVQARFARYRLPDIPDDVATEIDEIAETARGALQEMRQMLGVLRGDALPERAPQPTIDDLPALVEDVARSGTRIRTELDIPDGISTVVSMTTYRIVQEAISNAVQHAPGAEIDVSVVAGPEALMARVENSATGRGGSAALPRAGGHGIIGMRERVAMLNGTFAAGRTTTGGWHVEAVIPLGDAADPTQDGRN